VEIFMLRTLPMRRITLSIAIPVLAVLGILALNGGRIYDALSRWITPTPAEIIIVAPVDSETV